jgi:hypothetical protein
MVTVVAAIVCVVQALPINGLAAMSQTCAFPPQLVGTWTRTVTKADIKRAKVPSTEAGEVYPGLVLVLAIRKSGAARLTGAGHWDGRLLPVGADRVHITIPFDFPNVYRWRASERFLTLTEISDTDRLGARPAWFVGTWKRK